MKRRWFEPSTAPFSVKRLLIPPPPPRDHWNVKKRKIRSRIRWERKVWFNAGAASGMSAACYAEFACRVPKAGSAYVYIYLTLGELAAFVIGWNLILEHSLAVAAISRAAIGYIDALTNEAVQSSLPTYLQEHSWDYYSVIFIIIIGILVCCG